MKFNFSIFTSGFGTIQVRRRLLEIFSSQGSPLIRHAATLTVVQAHDKSDSIRSKINDESLNY